MGVSNLNKEPVGAPLEGHFPETFAIVGCKDSPNYQVWGARSDLGCKRKNKVLKMRFKDWVYKGEKKDGR